MSLARILASTIISLILSANSHALVSRVCEELPRPYLKLFQTITPPEAGQSSVEIQKFCHSNPHEFGTTSVSLREPEKRPKCYRSVNDEVVLEIPNLVFNDCKDADYFESMINHYAYKWAMRSSNSFSMVIYNAKHKFLKKSTFKEGSEIFQRVAYWKNFNEKAGYIREKMQSEEYGPEIILCLLQSTDSNGVLCPDDLRSRFPENYPIIRQNLNNR